MRKLPESSVHCCITSPPYYGLRNYGVDGQIGLEKTPEEYVAKMVEVFREVRRVLREDGTLWLNLGDSYNAAGRKGHGTRIGLKQQTNRASATGADSPRANSDGLKPKDLILIPWRVAMALQADGWFLRAACPWIKRNGMPDSVQDRPTQCIETVFMLTKSARCYYDSDAVKKVAKADYGTRDRSNGKYHVDGSGQTPHRGLQSSPSMRLRRSSDWFFESWQGLLLDDEGEPNAFVVNTAPFKGAHFAVFPPKLIEPCVLASTPERGVCSECGAQMEREVEKTTMVIDRSERTHELGRTRSSGTMVEPPTSRTLGWKATCACDCGTVPATILDPFGGSGTTGIVANQHGRNAILCELNPEYAEMARKRCET